MMNGLSFEQTLKREHVGLCLRLIPVQAAHSFAITPPTLVKPINLRIPFSLSLAVTLGLSLFWITGLGQELIDNLCDVVALPTLHDRSRPGQLGVQQAIEVGEVNVGDDAQDSRSCISF